MVERLAGEQTMGQNREIQAASQSLPEERRTGQAGDGAPTVGESTHDGGRQGGRSNSSRCHTMYSQARRGITINQITSIHLY